MTKVYQEDLDPLSSLSVADLRKEFTYQKGKLYRNGKDGLPDFSRLAGGKTGCGYIVVSINNKQYLAHRVIWKMHGFSLGETIDHINGNRTDNRIENLRLATKAQNVRNSGLRRDNKSGVKGVSYRKASKSWRGQVCFEGKCYSAGSFRSKDECAEAVRLLREALHGQFAKHATI
jgi:hypothetical protein